MLWQAIVDYLSDPSKFAEAASSHLARLNAEIAALTRGVGHIEKRIGDLERERDRWRESWVKFGGDPKPIEERIGGIGEELGRLRAQAEGRKAERDKLHSLRCNKDLIERALRHGLLDFHYIEDEGEHVRLGYYAGLIKDEDYQSWSRLEYDPERLAPEDWAWERLSLRITKKQLLDLLAIEIIAWPNRLEIPGVVSGRLLLKKNGEPLGNRSSKRQIPRKDNGLPGKTATKSGLPFRLRILYGRKIFFEPKEVAA
jgi:hypothetical protein